jgi:hypothetical protein
MPIIRWQLVTKRQMKTSKHLTNFHLGRRIITWSRDQVWVQRSHQKLLRDNHRPRKYRIVSLLDRRK